MPEYHIKQIVTWEGYVIQEGMVAPNIYCYGEGRNVVHRISMSETGDMVIGMRDGGAIIVPWRNVRAFFGEIIQ